MQKKKKITVKYGYFERVLALQSSLKEITTHICVKCTRLPKRTS